VRELIDEFCGGMADGHKFHAYLPGGVRRHRRRWTTFPDFGARWKKISRCFIGSAAVVILSERIA
jgi:formate dehydrogenase